MKTSLFRGIELGACIAEVEALEGANFIKKKGSNPSLYYYWDTGKVETIDLYFGLDAKEKVNRVSLTFYTYLDYYYEQQTGKDLSTFLSLFYKNDIQEYSKISDDLAASILTMLTNHLGTPSEEHKDEVFNKKYHNFNRWIWYPTYNGTSLRMSLTYYLDDSDDFSLQGVVKLFLSENITPN